MECQNCKSTKIVKNGIFYGKQRYLYKECRKTFIPRTLKYSKEEIIRVIKSYLRGVGIRAMGDIENIDFQLVFYWIKKLGKKL